MSTKLFTANWSALFAASKAGALDVQPVRISRGVPKFWPGASIFPAVETLMPDGWMLAIEDPEKFARCYRRKLHVAGPAGISEALTAIDSKKPLGLACFEAAREDCHRGQFADWWLRTTGEVVPEWEPPQMSIDMQATAHEGQAEMGIRFSQEELGLLRDALAVARQKAQAESLLALDRRYERVESIINRVIERDQREARGSR